MDLSMEEIETAIYCTAWVLEDFKKDQNKDLNAQYFSLCNSLYIKLVRTWGRKAAEQVERSIRGKVVQDRVRGGRMQPPRPPRQEGTHTTTDIQPQRETRGMERDDMMAG